MKVVNALTSADWSAVAAAELAMPGLARQTSVRRPALTRSNGQDAILALIVRDAARHAAALRRTPEPAPLRAAYPFD